MQPSLRILETQLDDIGIEASGDALRISVRASRPYGSMFVSYGVVVAALLFLPVGVAGLWSATTLQAMIVLPFLLFIACSLAVGFILGIAWRKSGTEIWLLNIGNVSCERFLGGRKVRSRSVPLTQVRSVSVKERMIGRRYGLMASREFVVEAGHTNLRGWGRFSSSDARDVNEAIARFMSKSANVQAR